MGLLDRWVQWTQRGFLPWPRWPLKAVCFTGACPCFIASSGAPPSPQSTVAFCPGLEVWAASQSGSLTWARCCVARMFSRKPLYESLLSTSPEWSPGPAGLRVQDSWSGSTVRITPLCLGVSTSPCLPPLPAPAEGFALGSWPNDAVRLSSPPPSLCLSLSLKKCWNVLGKNIWAASRWRQLVFMERIYELRCAAKRGE